MRTRIEFIDQTRGVGVLLVLLHHSGFFTNFILTFHMPLFFSLSGAVAFYRPNAEASIARYFIKRGPRLLVPYFLYSFLFLAISYFATIALSFFGLREVFRIDFAAAMKSIVLCINTKDYIGVTSVLWFFPCIFISGALFHTIHSVSKTQTATWSLAYSVIFFLLSWLENRISSSRLPFTLDISLMGTAFIFLGYAGANAIRNISTLNSFAKALVAAVGASGAYLASIQNTPFFMYINQYGAYPWAIAGSIFGILFICTATELAGEITPKDFIRYLSANSLPFFPIHIFVLALAAKLLSLLGFPPYSSIFLRIVLMVSTLGISLLLIEIINRYAPYLAGKPHKRVEPE